MGGVTYLHMCCRWRPMVMIWLHDLQINRSFTSYPWLSMWGGTLRKVIWDLHILIQTNFPWNKRIMACVPNFALISLVKVSLCIVRGAHIQLSIVWAYMIVARSKRYLNTCMLNIELPSVNKTDVMASINIYRFDLFKGCLKKVRV